MPAATVHKPSAERPTGTARPVSAPAGGRRSGFRAVVARGVFAVALAFGLVAGVPTALVVSAPSAQAVPAEEVVLADEAGIIHEPTLRAGIDDVSFHEPTTVVIFTQRGASGSNLNERVLASARQNHPEWLSADGQKWADGLYIYAIDPDSRQVGTYFGEDRKVSPGQRDDIQEDTKESLREANWTQAAIEGVEAAASVMNRPWYMNPVLWIVGAIGAAVAGLVALATVAVRRNQRQKAQADLETGRTSFGNVTLDLEATELNANTIPDGSRYGAQVLERYRTFHERYVQAAAENDRLAGVDPKTLHRKEHRTAISAFAELTEDLDLLDDTVASTNTLLNKHPGWPEAWDVQAAPLREDLGRIDELVQGDTVLDAAAVSPLQSFRPEAERELERLGAGLQTGETSPDDALDGLVALRTRLTELLEGFSAAQIAAYAKDSSERETLEEEMHEERQQAPRRPGSILDTVYQPGWFWTAAAYHSGFSAGQSSVEHDRQQAASSSSSSTTGYGSSGGSFSGSGSSSSF
jgi:uncharacterized membrane protein YgcG